MTANSQTAARDSKTGANLIPENAPKWESSAPGSVPDGHIVEVSFHGATTRKWESSAKPPHRVPNAERRSREYLTDAEVQKLISAAEKLGRHGHRDGTMILIAYRHALRVSELVSLKWDQVQFKEGLLHVRRLKNGIPSVHQLGGEEMRSLRAIKRQDGASRYVFMTERGAPMTAAGFRKMLSRLAVATRFTFPVHPHMLICVRL